VGREPEAAGFLEASAYAEPISASTADASDLDRRALRVSMQLLLQGRELQDLAVGSAARTAADLSKQLSTLQINARTGPGDEGAGTIRIPSGGPLLSQSL